MRETTTSAVAERDEEFVAIPVHEADRQRFRPIDATVVEGPSRSMWPAVAAVAAILLVFTAGYLVGAGGEPDAVPVQEVGMVDPGAPGASALRGDPGVLPARRGDDA